MRIDIMTDIETLGTSPDSTIIQIAAIAFNINTGEHISTFYKTADISKNESYEMTVSGETLKWWVNTDKELFAEMLNTGDCSSSELLEHFHKWLTALGHVGDLYLWGNGILFDNNILITQMGISGLDYPIHYRRDRDVRTILDITCSKLGMDEKEFKERCYNSTLRAHDAFNDVVNQIDMVVACYKELTIGSEESLVVDNDTRIKEQFKEMIKLSRTLEPRPIKIRINNEWIYELIEKKFIRREDFNPDGGNLLSGIPVEITDGEETYRFIY